MIKDDDFKAYKNILSASSKDRHANQLKKFKQASVVKKETPKPAPKKETPKIPPMSGKKGEVKLPNPMAAVKPKAPKLLTVKSKKQYQGTIDKLEKLDGTFDEQSQNREFSQILKLIKGQRAIALVSDFLNGDDKPKPAPKKETPKPAPKKETPKPAPKPKEEKVPDGVEKISLGGGQPIFRVKTAMKDFTQKIIKRFKENKPSQADLDRAIKQLDNLITGYEKQFKVKFVGDATKKLNELKELFTEDIRNYKSM